MFSWPCIALAIRAITSAPNEAWWLIVDATATAAPLRRSTSVHTHVVVPMSKLAPNMRSRVSPSSQSTRCSPTSVAVTLEPLPEGLRDRRQDLPVVVARVARLLDRVHHAAQVRAVVLERRGRQLEVELHDVGLEQHEPPDPHRGGLRHLHQPGHVDRHRAR